MSYDGEKLRIHILNRGKCFILSLIVGNPNNENGQESAKYEFINIKSLTDGLSEDEIISKYYEYLGLDASMMLEVNPPSTIAQKAQLIHYEV